jgi:ribonuclease P protein component
LQRPGRPTAPFDGAQGDPDPIPSSSSSFPKQRRIRRRSEFGTVFDGGIRVHGRLFTFLMLSNGLPASRLGIVASRKFGGAVDRNRAKRLIREMFRKLGPTEAGSGVDLVVIPKRELLGAEFAAIARDFGVTWRRGIDRVKAARGRG